jgi:two-component system response regulator YesN
MLSEKIVLIDDNPHIAASVRIGLPQYEIVDFQDPQMALDYLARPNLVNVVLLDYRMPNVNGLEVLASIKEKHPDIGVIMITAHGSKDVVLEALRRHADDFIEKPIQMKELKDTVRVVLKKKLHDQNLRTDKNNQIERIKKFVDRNCSNVNLNHIADELCLSPKYISRFFNLRNDSKYRDYKLKIKMDRAKKLLTTTKLDINEISIDLGYQNAESFMRIFKRQTTMTPTQYRRSLRAEKPKKSGKK